MCNTVCSTIENMDAHLSGLRAVMKRLYSDRCKCYNLLQDTAISMAKVVGGHVSSHNIKRVAKEEFVQANADFAAARLPLTPRVEFHVFKKRCWNHLWCTWVENVRKETNGWMANTF